MRDKILTIIGPTAVGKTSLSIEIAKLLNGEIIGLDSRQIYFDIVSPLPEAMRFALDFTSADRLLFSSDHPWVDPALIRDCLKGLELKVQDEEKILGGNARRLFNL